MTRDDLERLDTPSLRALARQHLPGRAKSLHTRAALLAALGEGPLSAVAPQPAPKPRRRRAPGPKVAPGSPPPHRLLRPSR